MHLRKNEQVAALKFLLRDEKKSKIYQICVGIYGNLALEKSLVQKWSRKFKKCKGVKCAAKKTLAMGVKIRLGQTGILENIP